jgi:sarcosine oxidase gamma subunit
VHRVAPDEAMAIDESASALQEHLRVVDADAVVIDTTDGWTAFTITGEGAREAFARLSEMELPPDGFAQGDCARVPVKVLTEGDHLTVLVPAMWGAYLGERLAEAVAGR